MADKSSIEWTESTLNAWTGCRKVSAGCAHCYIDRTPPFRMAGRKFVKGVTLDREGNGPVVYHLDRIDRMVRRTTPTLYFVNSLSDVFLEDVHEQVIAQLWAGMARAPQHTFQVLTKRPERMAKLLNGAWFPGEVEAIARAEGVTEFQWPLPQTWLGVSVENRAQVGRADLLRETPAAVRFLSCEPLLGPLVPSFFSRFGTAEGRMPVTYSGYEWPDGKSPSDVPGLSLAGIDWVIAGGESGPGARPCREEWLRDLRDACVANGVRYFVKQLGGHPRKRGGDEAVLDGQLWREMPDGQRGPLEAPQGAQGSLL